MNIFKINENEISLELRVNYNFILIWLFIRKIEFSNFNSDLGFVIYRLFSFLVKLLFIL